MAQTDAQAMLHSILEEIRGDIRELKEGLVSVDKAIRGNGKPGLNQRVAAIEDRLKLVAGAFLLGTPVMLEFVKRKLGLH